jgi:hypothetical protein
VSDDPRYLVFTNGNCNGMLLWDHGTVCGSPRPGQFVMQVAPHRVPDLLKERGVDHIELLRNDYETD